MSGGEGTSGSVDLGKFKDLPIDLGGHEIHVDRERLFPVREPTPEKPMRVFSRQLDCGNCGDEVRVLCDGARFFTEAAPCKYPGGPPPTEFSLNVPSGKIGGRS